MLKIKHAGRGEETVFERTEEIRHLNKRATMIAQDRTWRALQFGYYLLRSGLTGDSQWGVG